MPLKVGGEGGNLLRRGDKRSERHIRYQKRLADLLRQYGFKHIAIEKRMPYYLPQNDGKIIKIRYRVDVYGRRGPRRIAIEIDGFMGHKSKRACEMDGLRSRRIQEKYEPIEIHRFTFGQLAHWTDKEIAEEIRLSC